MVLNLKNLYPNLKSIEFLHDRILSVNYRGQHLSQHNRFDLDLITGMLQLIFDLVGDNLMQIRTTDLSKRPHNIPGESIYAEYTKRVVKMFGRGTQDSIRKNLFVDFNRLGLIDRYDSNNNLLTARSKGHAKFISLSKLGLALISKNSNLINKRMIFSRGIDSLLKSLPSTIFTIMIDLDYITLDEYTYFLSFLNCELNGKTYYQTELVDFIKEFRKLSKFQKEGIKAHVNQYCDPKNFSGNKNNLWDYHNWFNESQQIFTILNDVAYFEYNQFEERLTFKVNTTILNSNTPIIKINRSIKEKHLYYKNHNIQKQYVYELHHIVPLFWAKTPVEFDILDSWDNMLYIDGKSHSIISQTGNILNSLSFANNDIILSDKNNNNLTLSYQFNVKYNINLKKLIQNKNSTLLNTFK
jgi:hypothetical protein